MPTGPNESSDAWRATYRGRTADKHEHDKAEHTVDDNGCAASVIHAHQSDIPAMPRTSQTDWRKIK